MKILEPIAVIGMAGRFPGAHDLEEFWQNIAAGRDCISELDEKELADRGERAEYLRYPTYVRRQPCMPDPDMFDALCFGMTPRETQIRDPQHRAFLELTHTALEHAGYDPRRYPDRIGVFGGCNGNRYRIDNLEPSEEIRREIGFLPIELANSPDYLATFVSFKLGLRGPSMTVQTACSTSLIAIHLACQSLRLKECEMAVAGGSSFEMPVDCGYFWVEGGITARDGRPRPFDSSAAGTVFGTGAGTVVLKRLSVANEDGDTIYAVIRGSSVNNDGSQKTGFSAPSVEGQAACVAEALRQARVDPSQITFIEAHATGTKVGDPIEVAALTDAFRQRANGDTLRGDCVISSVKANVGHLGPAAGICAFIKTVLALGAEEIPPSTGIERLNPKLSLQDTPFTIRTEPTPWPRTEGNPRLAGVSSFGIGGSNCHVIVEEPPVRKHPAQTPRSAELLVWSGASRSAVSALEDRIASHIAEAPESEFRNIVHTLRVGRTERKIRGALVADRAANAAAQLRSGRGVIRSDGLDREIVFAFPGQGAQHSGMAHDLYREEPRFRHACDHLFEIAGPLMDGDLRAEWLEDTGRDALMETSVAQPLLYIIECALAEFLNSCDVRPAYLIGHSVGELAAAAVAGVFSREDGVRAIIARSSLMQQAPAGTMLAVAASREAIAGYLNDRIALAAVNGSHQVVLSGPAQELAEASTRLRLAGCSCVPLKTSRAFHSPLMRDAAERFREVLSDIALAPPKIPILSCVTGKEMTSEEATDPLFWARQITQPVYFGPTLNALIMRGPMFLVEAGPGQTLSSLMRGSEAVRDSSSVVLPTQPSAGAAEHRRAGHLEKALGRLWVQGVPVDLLQWAYDPSSRRVPVPGYPYERRRHWVEQPSWLEPIRQGMPLPGTFAGAAPASGTGQTPGQDGGAAANAQPAPANEPGNWSAGMIDWVRSRNGRPAVISQRAEDQPAVLVLPADPAFAEMVRTSFRKAGYALVQAAGRPGSHREHESHAGSDAGPDDGQSALHALSASGGSVVGYGKLLDAPDNVSLAELDEQLERGLHELWSFARALVREQRRHSVPFTLIVCTVYAVDVTGDEPVNPATAMIMGFLRTMEREHPEIRTRVVDITSGTSPDVFARELSGQLAPLTALRGTSVWTPALRPVARQAVTGYPRLREKGVYLITGGLGGIGLTIATALATTGLQPRIALLGRGSSPAQARQTDAKRDALTAVGAEVLVVSGDVSSLDSLNTAVGQVEAQFGPINGVVHAAGVPGGGLLERRDRPDIDAVLAPKVRGTLTIDQVFADRPPLDFLALFSSQAGLSGMIGSADYSGANAFLDAFAQMRGRNGRWALSIAWPGWSEVGMLARSAAAPVILGAGPQAPGGADRPTLGGDEREIRAPAEYRLTLRDADNWELDEHRFDGTAVLPGTASLELAVTAARSLGLVAGDVPVEVRDMILSSPIISYGELEIRVVFATEGAGYRFGIESSRPGGWEEHATGFIGPAQVAARTADAAALTTRLLSSGPPALDDWITLGPRWDCVAAASTSGNETLLDLVLPGQFHHDLIRHPLHPALIDRAALSGLDGAEQQHYVPLMYGRAIFFADVPSRAFAHNQMSRDQGQADGSRILDVELYDPETGAELARIESYTLREVPPGPFAARRADGPVPADPEAASADAGLLRPDEGATAFLELINGDYPSYVLVSPPGNHLQADGRIWLDEKLCIGLAELAANSGPTSAPPVSVIPEPGAAPTSGSPPAGRPSADEIIADLQEIWAQALGLDEISADDDFFDLGGNSLVAVQLTVRVRERFKTEISAGILFEASTIRELAEKIAAQVAS